MVDRKAIIDETLCIACGNCVQRCIVDAIVMDKLEEQRILQVSIDDLPASQVDGLCIKAGMNPSQVICYCTGTRAEEVAAAIIKGASSPEEISLETGLRGGCTVFCLQPALRLLEAHGVFAVPPEGGWQWYGRTPTLAEIPDEVKAKYSKLGFHFDEDLELFETVVQSERR